MIMAPFCRWRAHSLTVRLSLIVLLIWGMTSCADEQAPGDRNRGEVNYQEGDVDDFDSVDHEDIDDEDVEDEEDAPEPPDVDEDTDEGDSEEEDIDPNEPVDPVELALQAIYPSRGPHSGGTPFILDGQGFTPHTQILFGSTAVPVDLIDGKLNGVTPASLGPGPVSIRAFDENTGEDNLIDGFTYIEALQIQAVQPARATVDGGVQLTISGQGFSADAQITIGGRPVMEQTFLSSTQLRAIAPPHPAGMAHVRVTDQNGSVLLENGLEYIAPLTLTSVHPPIGAAQGGELVTLQGAQFGEDLQVFFGGIQATVTEIDPAGKWATVLTPPHTPGLVHVNIQTGGGGATRADGFGYLASTAEAASFDGALPNRGHKNGGDEVYLVGHFPDAQHREVFFGAAAATIIEATEGMLLVETPAADAGPVDITVTLDDETLILPGGFRFYQPLQIAGLSPAEGSAQGGTVVTVTGQGFDLIRRVTLGGKPVSFTVTDDETIEFTTPASAGGKADLIVYGSGVERQVVEGAFTYLEELQLWSHTPTRGSTAGNTYVVLRGQGFTEDTRVFFGDEEALDIQLIDPFNLALRTPAHSAGNTTITAQNSAADQVSSPEPYTYYNPGSPAGGAWGNPIDGAVNVLVYSTSGQAVEGAFVMLSTNAQTPYAGLTDTNGMITLSGPDVYGEQTITATAAEHSSTTVQRVNAENITIFLTGPADGDGAFPPPPPMATFSGYIEGLDKLERPSANQVLLARVYSTRPRLRSQNTEPGPNNVVLEDGRFTIQTRVGDLALVAVGGLYDLTDSSFTPLRMGVVRHLFAADGEHYEVEINLNIPLNQTLFIKYTDPPLATPGPNQTRAQLYLDLGLDGVYGPFDESYITDSSLHGLDYVAPLVGDIADASYIVDATTSTGGGIPFVQTTLRGIDDLSVVHATKPLTSTINMLSPQPGQLPRGGLVQWELHGLHEPDFYYIVMDTAMGEILWEVFLTGSARSFRFPDFPDFSQFGMEALPLPYPGGLYYLTVFGISKDGTSGDHFTYSDLDPNTFNSYSVFQTIIAF